MSEDDFGFSGITSVPVKLEKTSDQKLQEVKNMILPLIHNLMKDPDKDIHWPGRDVKLQEFKDKLLKVIDG